jgi:hypothetical protein
MQYKINTLVGPEGMVEGRGGEGGKKEEQGWKAGRIDGKMEGGDKRERRRRKSN